MKAHSLCFFVLLALSVTSVIHLAASEMILLKIEDSGREITVPRDSIIEIQLEELASAGYSWKFQDLDQDFFEVLKEENKARGPEGLLGAPAVKVWRLKAKKEGKTQIKMDYYRVWEGRGSAVNSFNVTIRIL